MVAEVWSLERGARIVDGGVRFAVWSPNARSVEVRVRAPVERRAVLARGAHGVFDGTVPGIGAGADYVYVLDDGPELPDPVSRWQPHDVHGPSRVVDPAAFAWTDAAWRGRAMADLTVIYELHVGTFTPEGTFAAAAGKLRALRELGVAAIELMPVAEFPGGRNWGYDGVLPYAPESSYGAPDDLRRLVDAAHREGLAVILDVVYNHLGPEGNVLSSFGPYFTERYCTPWGPAINYDGAGSDEVRRYVIDNALYWVTEFHVDGLRLDAVHGIYDFGARHVLAELAARVHAQGEALGRQAVVIAESDLNDPKLLRPARCGGYALDAQWSDDFHHAVHVVLTGERSGYYADFEGVQPVAKALAERFVYDGIYSSHRRKRHGAPARDVSADHFVVSLQNHDQIGNRAGGERLSALVDREQLRLAAALLLLSPYVPMLFMGEEYGETNPFLYFVSHTDAELAEAVRQGRRREFASFGWSEEVPDPLAEATFRRSKLDWARSDEPGHRELRQLHHDLLALRRAEPLLRPGRAGVRVAMDERAPWVTLALVDEGAERTGPDSPRALVALFNFAADAVEIPVAGAAGARWRLCLSTDDVRYGGKGRAARRIEEARNGTPTITVAARSAALYERESA